MIPNRYGAAQRLLDEQRDARSVFPYPSAGKIPGGFGGFLNELKTREAVWQCPHKHDGRTAAHQCAAKEAGRRILEAGL